MNGLSAKRNELHTLMSSVRPVTIIIGIVLIYFLSLSALSVLQHHGLKTQMNDLGNADQAIWNAANGDFLMMQSNDLDGKLRSRIGVHANLIFWPLSFLYRVLPYPELLLMLSSLACAMAGLGLYLIARHRLGNTWFSLIPSGAFFLSPLVHDANLYDFHIITVFTSLLIWAFWAFDTGRKKAACGLFFLALLCNEDVALITFMFGIYLVLSGSKRTGVLVAAVSLLYFVLLLNVLVPFLNEGHGLTKLEGPYNRYAWLGNGFGNILFSVFTHPLAVLKTIFRPDHIRVIAYLLLCGGLAGLKEWRILILALPQAAEALISRGIWMTRITGTYYWITCEAIVIMACIFAAERKFKASKKNPALPLLYLGTVTCVLSLILSPLPYSISSSWENYSLPPERNTLQEIKHIIPSEASLCVQNNLGPHLSQRRDIASFPRRCNLAEYALFHLRYVGGPDSGLFIRTSPVLFGAPPGVLYSGMKDMILSGDWEVISQKDGFSLLQHRPSGNMNKKELLLRAEADFKILENSYREASNHRLKWAGYLTGTFSWEQIFRDE